MTDNQIGDEGVKSLSEMLKVNTKMTHLYLHSELEKKRNTKMNGLISRVLIMFSDNGIGNEGAKALGDSLKTHTLLKKLWLGGEIHFIRL